MPRVAFVPVALLLLLAAASSASAQDTDAEPRDHYEQMIDAVQQRRERSLEQVMSAPTKVQDSIRHTDVDIGDGTRASKPVQSPFEPERRDDTWMIVTAAGVLLLGGSVFYFTLRRAQQ
jgi:hypothetical protein